MVNKVEEKVDELKKMREELGEIEMSVLTNYSLADAIREGGLVTVQAFNWGNGESACAMSAAVIAARSRGFM